MRGFHDLLPVDVVGMELSICRYPEDSVYATLDAMTQVYAVFSYG
jgi:hypothetical protein